jgi:hypothetical protein
MHSPSILSENKIKNFIFLQQKKQGNMRENLRWNNPGH